MASIHFGIGSMTGHGIPWEELLVERYILD